MDTPKKTDSPVCECGTVMVEHFNYKRIGPAAELAIPNGKFECMRCGKKFPPEPPTCGECEHWRLFDVARQTGECSAPSPMSEDENNVRWMMDVGIDASSCPCYKKREE